MRKHYSYYPEEKPNRIYLFRVNNRSKKLERLESAQWDLQDRGRYKIYKIKFTSKSTTFYRIVEQSKFDQFLNKNLITFNPSEEHAIAMMQEYAKSQLTKFQKMYNSWKIVLEILENEGGDIF